MLTKLWLKQTRAKNYRSLALTNFSPLHCYSGNQPFVLTRHTLRNLDPATNTVIHNGRPLLRGFLPGRFGTTICVVRSAVVSRTR